MQGEEILEMFYEQIERPRLSYHTKSAESANRLTHMIRLYIITQIQQQQQGNSLSYNGMIARTVQ